MNFVRKMSALAAAMVAGSAGAQALPRFEVERLQLDPSARGSLVVGTGEVAPAGSFRIAAAAHREHRPLVLVAPSDVLGRRDDSGTVALIEDRDTLHLVLDVVVLPRVEVYGRGTFIVNQEPDDPSGDSTGFGMPSFGVRLGALQQSAGAPVNVAIAAEFLPPWGNGELLARLADPAGLVRVEIGRDLGRAVVGVEGALLLKDKQTIGVREMGSELRYGAVIAGKGLFRPELSYRGAYGINGDKGPGSGELLGGLRVSAGPIELFGLGGPGFFNRVGTPQWRALAGVAIKLDREKAAAPAAAPPPADPCAPGQTHTPEQCPNLDDDGDGVANKDDACPTKAGIAKAKGCPAKDSDGDGVQDHLDRCPTEAGTAELKGCPPKDSDRDSVADHQDKCPTEAGPADNQGCPRVVVQKEAKKVELREKVQFDIGKATIKPESDPLLDEIANVLKAHPEIKRVLIEGHSDSTGSAALNNRLSQARADSVLNALVARRVEKARLSAKGFGPSRPIASNDTPEGREANRRVEITIAQSE